MNNFFEKKSTLKKLKLRFLRLRRRNHWKRTV